MYPIVVGEKITISKNVFQGAYGILAGTRCKILDVVPPLNPGLPASLTVQALGAAPIGLCLRMGDQDTMEGQLNRLELQVGGLLSDREVLHEALKELGPVTSKLVRDKCLLKLSPQGQTWLLEHLPPIEENP